MDEFKKLRNANAARVGHFKNNEGRIAHTKPNGSDWSPMEWGAAAAGEMGELLNLLKKLKRGEHINMVAVSHELADVIIYLDLLALQLDIDIWSAIVNKFNITSCKVDSPVRLGTDEHY